MLARKLTATSGRAVDWWRAGGAPEPVAVYQPIGAASLAASYVNLANPGTFDAAPGGAPTLGAAGWTFNGSTQFLTTGIIPTNDQQFSMITRFSGATIGINSTVAGMFNNSIRQFRLLNASAGAGVVYSNGTQNQSLPELAAGVLAIAGNQGYRNGMADVTVTDWGGAATRDVYVAATNSGVANQFLNGNIQAIAIYSSTLTAPQVAAVSAAMAAL